MVPVQVLTLTLKLLVKTALEEKDLDLPASWLLLMAPTDLPNPKIPALLPFPVLVEREGLSSPSQPRCVLLEAWSPQGYLPWFTGPMVHTSESGPAIASIPAPTVCGSHHMREHRAQVTFACSLGMRVHATLCSARFLLSEEYGNSLQLFLAYQMVQAWKGGGERLELMAEQDLLLQILLRGNGHSRNRDHFPQRVQLPYYTVDLKVKFGDKSYMQKILSTALHFFSYPFCLFKLLSNL